MNYEVGEGKEFPVDNFQKQVDMEIQLEGSRNRTLILWVSLSMMAVFVIGAAIIGLIRGQYGELDSVSRVAVPISFMLIGYYYGKKPKE